MIPVIRTKTGKEVRVGDSWKCETPSKSGSDRGDGMITLMAVFPEKRRAIVRYKGQMVTGELIVTTEHPNWQGQKVGLLII